MNLSNKSQYAIRVVSYMALRGDQLYKASVLVSQLKVPDKYLKRILTKLSSSGILRSIQGRCGGFQLARRNENITLWDIIESMEGVEKYIDCVLGIENCSDDNHCILHKKWLPLKEELKDFLIKCTINDVIRMHQERESKFTLSYTIY